MYVSTFSAFIFKMIRAFFNISFCREAILVNDSVLDLRVTYSLQPTQVISKMHFCLVDVITANLSGL